MQFYINSLLQIELVKRSSFASNDIYTKCIEIEQNLVESMCSQYFEEVSSNIEEHDGYLVLQKENDIVAFEFPPFDIGTELNGDQEYTDNVFEIPMLDDDMEGFTKSIGTFKVLLGTNPTNENVYADVECVVFEHKDSSKFSIYLLSTFKYKELCKENNVLHFLTADDI